MSALRVTPEARQAREEARWAELARGRRRLEALLARCCPTATVTEFPANSYAHARVTCAAHGDRELGSTD